MDDTGPFFLVFVSRSGPGSGRAEARSAMDVTKPYKFKGFVAMDVTKPYEFMGFGATDVTKPYKFMGFGTMDVTKPL